MSADSSATADVDSFDILAVDLVHAMFAGLPPERVASALVIAETEAVARLLRIAFAAHRVECYAQGWDAGRGALDREIEDDWKPIAQRVRRSANRPSFDELLAIRGEARDGNGGYRAIPQPIAYQGGRVEWPSTNTRSTAA